MANTSDPSDTPARGRSEPGGFYRYREGDRTVIVDSLDHVPHAQRSGAERVSAEALKGVTILPSAWDPSAVELHGPSFGAGAVAGLAIGVLAAWLWRGTRRVLPVALALGVGALGAGLYFGWLRRVTGHSRDATASPAALIEDARAAVDQWNRRAREQEQVLRDLREQSR